MQGFLPFHWKAMGFTAHCMNLAITLNADQETRGQTSHPIIFQSHFQRFLQAPSGTWGKSEKPSRCQWELKLPSISLIIMFLFCRITLLSLPVSSIRKNLYLFTETVQTTKNQTQQCLKLTEWLKPTVIKWASNQSNNQ